MTLAFRALLIVSRWLDAIDAFPYKLRDKYKYFMEDVTYGDIAQLRRAVHGDPPPDPDMDLPWE